jgi:hypothetical protein
VIKQALFILMSFCFFEASLVSTMLSPPVSQTCTVYLPSQVFYLPLKMSKQTNKVGTQ